MTDAKWPKMKDYLILLRPMVFIKMPTIEHPFWGCGVAKCEVLSVGPDAFKSKMHTYSLIERILHFFRIIKKRQLFKAYKEKDTLYVVTAAGFNYLYNNIHTVVIDDMRISNGVGYEHFFKELEEAGMVHQRKES